ncbi:hypothetical protein F5Y04DRAFT_230444 [Hypomontagnella monticulosa]|nr:hypothetical protein F5Y04DRAFT_230444 [Hypomontagnella monticulosa]
MFGNSRRHRPPNPPLNAGTANPNATSAAATAFMSASNQKPGKSLSSAAAAAALRARPHTPTNVAEVQTKRTIRRSASVSSAGSAAVAAATSRPSAQLERKNSSSSMTERTFRSPSPHRAGPMQMTEERPPVPQIPAGHKKSTSLASAGVGMQTFRTASQKMKAKHTSWYTEPSGDPSNVRTSDAPMKTRKPELPKPEITTTIPQRPDSRSSSVNFSYPTVFRAQSPPASPSSTHAPQFSSPPPRTPASPPRSNRASISSVTSGKHEQPMVYDPNSRRMIPKAIVDNVEYYVKEASEKQPKKKKNVGVQREGSHLKKGTVARVRGTTIDAEAGERDLPKREQPVIEATPTLEESRILEEPAVKAIITSSGKSGTHQGETGGSSSFESRDLQKSRAESPPLPGQFPSESGAGFVASRGPTNTPAVEQIYPDEVSSDEDSAVRPSQKILDALDAVPTRLSIFKRHKDIPGSADESTEVAQQQLANNTALGPAEPSVEIATETKAAPVENKLVTELSREGSNVRRSNSSSPARQAHFSVAPLDSLAVRHTPLPRSASPIKSALKRTSPTPREVSPSDKGSDMSGSRGASPYQQDDPTVPRKKSVRVSFDDRTMATVVGESAVPGDTDDSIEPASPQQVKRPWYSNIGRSKRREYTLDDDEIMKPRPALPSFGSIREKKTKETGERPLVRPYEATHSPAAPSSPELRPSDLGASADTGTPDELSLGQSSDHAIGSILVQEQTSRNAPNISRFREPLPPVVTSVEGSGYMSDSSKSSDSDDDLLDSIAGASDTEEIPSTQATQLETQNSSQHNASPLEEKRSTNANTGTPDTIHLPPQDIPEITVIQPSPRAPEQSTAVANLVENRYFDVPGGFPDENLDKTQDTQAMTKSIENENVLTSAPPIFEPTATVHSAQPQVLPQTTLATTTPLDSGDDESTDDSASIYSDAYEDPREAEGDGFLSLNAVVESPIDEPALPHVSELPGDIPNEVTIKYQSRTNTQAGNANPLGLTSEKDDWEQAKAFWRSLTADKRRQLEREAMEEAGVEGDKEETTPVRKNSGRKKTTQKQQTPVVTRSQPSAKSSEVIPQDKAKQAHAAQPTTKSDPRNDNLQTSTRMRMSLRGEKPGQASDGLRKTMRSHTGTGQANQTSTVRTTQREKPSPVLSKPAQPRISSTPAQTTPINRAPSSIPNDKPSLQRRGSDASDSSFKRNRATRGGGFARHSMRPSSANPSHEVTKGSGRFSLRSLSPTGSTSFRHSSGGPTPTMRHTLRSSSVSSQERILPSIHFPSFGRSGKATATKRSKKSSRFGDSSDEDEGGASGFRSRFDDSSDEESVRPGSSSKARPLSRGTLRTSTASASGFRKSTPVPEVDEESPQLPDSDDEMPSPLQTPRTRPSIGVAGPSRSNSGALGTATLTRSRSGRGGFNTSVTMPSMSQKERRSSFMGILRRNKRADTSSKIQRSELMDSAARRDTRLERNNEELKDLRGEHPSSPKLQKRASVRRNDSWPLDEPAEGEVKRSNSAGNILDQVSAGKAALRPELNGRRSTSMGLPTTYDNEADNVTVDGIGGHRKKKKFGALRRMFGLDD